MLTFLAAAAIACNTLSVDAPRAYPAGQFVPFVHVADYDGDGRLDVGIPHENEFAIRYNTGGGNLSEPLTFAHTGYIVGAANFVGDALPDLVDNPHRVRENRGGRDFPVAVTSNAINARPLIADFTNDGRAEMIVVGFEAATVLAIDGTTVRQLSTIPLGEFTRDLLAADFNGDGRLDLFAQHRIRGYYRVYMGDGEGHFALTYVVTSNPDLAGVIAADFDRDGRADLAAGAYDDGISKGLHIIYATGDIAELPVPERTPAGPVAAADFDRDGDLDLLAQHFPDAGPRTQVYRNDNGTFTPVAQSFAIGQPLHYADFTGDDIPDLLVSGGNAVGILKGNADGTFRVPAPLPLTLAFSPFAFDLDGNGLDELIFYGGAGHSVARPDGAGGFSVETLPFANGTLLAAARNEIAVGNALTGEVALYTHGSSGWTLVRTFAGPPLDDLALGDFTGDGRSELATIANVSGARSLRVRETHTGRALLDQALPPGQYEYDVLAHGNRLILALSGTAKVFNGDPPIVEIEQDGRVLVYSFSATGAVTQQTALADGAFTRTVAGDFNGDGRLDVLSAASLAYGRPDGSFAPAASFAGTFLERVAGDLNGDGTTDLVAKTFAGFTYWLGSPAGLQRADGEWLSSPQAPVIARLRHEQPASILFGSPDLNETRVECAKKQGKRRGVRH